MKQISMVIKYDTLRKLLLLSTDIEVAGAREIDAVKDGFIVTLFSENMPEELLGRPEPLYDYPAPRLVDKDIAKEIFQFIKSKGVETIAELQYIITEYSANP